MSTPKTRKTGKPEKLTPSRLVIARFGGIRPFARKLNAMYQEQGRTLIHHTMVCRWSRVNGRIPTARTADLQALAIREKVKLTSDEILNGGYA